MNCNNYSTKVNIISNFEVWQYNYTKKWVDTTIGQLLIDLSSLSIESNPTSSGTSWDFKITIDGTDPFGKTAYIKDLDVRLENGDGEVIRPDIELEVLEGDLPATMSAQYNKTYDDWVIHRGDWFVITGLDKEFEGGWVHLVFDSHTLGSVEIPSDFP